MPPTFPQHCILCCFAPMHHLAPQLIDQTQCHTLPIAARFAPTCQQAFITAGMLAAFWVSCASAFTEAPLLFFFSWQLKEWLQGVWVCVCICMFVNMYRCLCERTISINYLKRQVPKSYLTSSDYKLANYQCLTHSLSLKCLHRHAHVQQSWWQIIKFNHTWLRHNLTGRHISLAGASRLYKGTVPKATSTDSWPHIPA